MWLLEEKEFEDPGDYFGYVYLITNNITGKKYIGRKYFTKAHTRQIKGKKKRSRIENDWKDYWGSCLPLLEDVSTLGAENFKREVIKLCKTRGETNYWEVKLQFEHNVLEAKLPNNEPAYYNANIAMKFTRKNIGKILEDTCGD